jgi:hypothetical protein
MGWLREDVVARITELYARRESQPLAVYKKTKRLERFLRAAEGRRWDARDAAVDLTEGSLSGRLGPSIYDGERRDMSLHEVTVGDQLVAVLAVYLMQVDPWEGRFPGEPLTKIKWGYSNDPGIILTHADDLACFEKLFRAQSYQHVAETYVLKEDRKGQRSMQLAWGPDSGGCGHGCTNNMILTFQSGATEVLSGHLADDGAFFCSGKNVQLALWLQTVRNSIGDFRKGGELAPGAAPCPSLPPHAAWKIPPPAQPSPPSSAP